MSQTPEDDSRQLDTVLLGKIRMIDLAGITVGFAREGSLTRGDFVLHKLVHTRLVPAVPPPLMITATWSHALRILGFLGGGQLHTLNPLLTCLPFQDG